MSALGQLITEAWHLPGSQHMQRGTTGCRSIADDAILVLAVLYRTAPSDVALVCDNHLDNSGEVLGWVRNRAQAMSDRSHS